MAKLFVFEETFSVDLNAHQLSSMFLITLNVEINRHPFPWMFSKNFKWPDVENLTATQRAFLKYSRTKNFEFQSFRQQKFEQEMLLLSSGQKAHFSIEMVSIYLIWLWSSLKSVVAHASDLSRSTHQNKQTSKQARKEAWMQGANFSGHSWTTEAI